MRSGSWRPSVPRGKKAGCTLNWLGFENRDVLNQKSVPSDRAHPGQKKSCCLKQDSPLLLAALSAAGYGEHVEIAHQAALELRICTGDERGEDIEAGSGVGCEESEKIAKDDHRKEGQKKSDPGGDPGACGGVWCGHEKLQAESISTRLFGRELPVGAARSYPTFSRIPQSPENALPRIDRR